MAAPTSVGDDSIAPVAGIVVDAVNSYAMNVFWSIDWAASSMLSLNLTQRFFASAQDDIQKVPSIPGRSAPSAGCPRRSSASHTDSRLGLVRAQRAPALGS